MQVVIDIDDNLYTRLFDNGDTDAVDMLNACVAIRKGTPLPKKLVDADVLDKIRSEIKEKFEGCDICEWFDDYDYEDNNISEYRFVGSIDTVLDIIDKYRGSEVSNADSN